ncbi:hypothetical protein NADFUDRAFT_82931 [Nadsonia fulvescens var. elongata DSM 6958]|uniref:Uncharacterized protein n=1 Tax=Nadsonia fulvescens var. elongata DSM 6958 TaxID=857566 RepID=A0A1E3PKU1_9ASCO|nr:hypothetical protein NADFUDRAFT_82931 [Nadsonia fulvescens var. elongata DSM 6958]
MQIVMGWLPVHPAPIVLSAGILNPNCLCIESITLSLSTTPTPSSRPASSIIKQIFGFGSIGEISFGSKTDPHYNGDLVIENYVGPRLEAKVKANKDVITLDRGFQYGPVEGVPSLRKFRKELVKTFLSPRLLDTELDLVMTNGAGDGI